MIEEILITWKEQPEDPGFVELVEIFQELSVIYNGREHPEGRVWELRPESERAGEALQIHRENFGEK